MKIFKWSLTEQLSDFDLTDSGAIPSVWRECTALYFENDLAAPVLLRDDLDLKSFRMQAEIACPGPYGFVGLIFGARDSKNYELVYISPAGDEWPGSIQYDPIMNGSSTWQIYHGPRYQADAPFTAGEWTKVSLDVHPNHVSISVGDTTSPQLIITNLQHGGHSGRIGVWGYLPSYIRNLMINEILPIQMESGESVGLSKLVKDTYITDWSVSKPYHMGERPEDESNWINVPVEENGTLNINRLYPSDKGYCVQVKSTFSLDEENETQLSFGFSDQLRLWVNETEVYQGAWRWDPPSSDGRIRPDFASIPIRWKKGLNTIRAEIISDEVMFGWGLSLKTGRSPRSSP